MKKQIILPIILAITLLSAVSVKAWVEPDQMPPAGNITAPLNSSSFAQTKLGGLILNIGNAIYGLIVKNGNSGFGTETPTERVDVNGNIKLNGRVVGMQAPIDGNDGVNKNYVDALGGGGGSTYNVWGTTDCATGDEKIYEGVSTIPMVHIMGYGTVGGGGTPICKKGDRFRNTQYYLKQFVLVWGNGTSQAPEDVMSPSYPLFGGINSGDPLNCALCKTK